MSKPVWYRSLYWRIAFGFIALLAVVLGAQIFIFLWLTDRIVGPSSRSPQQLATSVATDLAKDLEADPNLHLDTHLRSKFGHIYQPFLVVLNDGRVGSNRGEGLPGGFMRSVMPRGRRFGGRFGGPEPWRQSDGRGGGPDSHQPGAPPNNDASNDARGGRPPDRPDLKLPDRPSGGDARSGGPPDRGDGGRGDRPDLGRGDRVPDAGDPRGPHRAETATITVNGTEAGTVIVP